MIERIHQVLSGCERFLNKVAAVMLFAIMLVVVCDVFLRYFFNAPLAWSYELISLYLMVGLFFFALSDTLNHNGHVSVDILHNYMPSPLRHLAECVAYGCASLVFIGIFYVSLIRTYESFIGGDVMAGGIAWPTWVSYAAVPLGCGLMLLRMLFRFIGHGFSLVQGRSVIALPPVAGAEETLS